MDTIRAVIYKEYSPPDVLRLGEIDRLIVDRCCPLHEVPDALRYLEEGHARGKNVITVNGALNR